MWIVGAAFLLRPETTNIVIWGFAVAVFATLLAGYKLNSVIALMAGHVSDLSIMCS